MVSALIAAALALVMHNSSVGTHRLVFHVDGTVEVEVALHDDDAFDLCAIDAADGAGDGSALRGCFARTLPARLRLSLDDVPCPLRLGGLTVADETVTLSATATCPGGQRWWVAAPLVIDWGLFAGTGRGHVSSGHVLMAGTFMGEGAIVPTRLASDAPKLTVGVPPRLPGAPLLAALGIAAGLAAWRWRRSSRGQ